MNIDVYHKVVLNDDRHLVWKATGWCIDNFGIDSTHFLNGTWYSRRVNPWDKEYREFRFQNESDAIMFALRWQ